MRKNTKLYNEKSSKELEKEANVIREEIAKMKLSFKSNPPKDTNILTKKRNQLAVLLTVLSGKKQV
jgi:ribosomal protein L29